jgi:hypothetical protein
MTKFTRVLANWLSNLNRSDFGKAVNNHQVDKQGEDIKNRKSLYYKDLRYQIFLPGTLLSHYVAETPIFCYS